MSAIGLIFWISIFFIFYTYLFYPLILLIIDKFAKSVVIHTTEDLCQVTLIIAAYNEEKSDQRPN